MSVQVVIDGRRIGQGVMFDEQAARDLSRTIATVIRVRTFSRGLGSDDRPLPAYTPRYAARRAKAGRKTSPVDYTWTGQLRRKYRVLSLRKRGHRTQITFGVTGNRAIVAAALEQRGVGWQRLSPNDTAIVNKALPSIIAQSQARSAGRG